MNSIRGTTHGRGERATRNFSSRRGRVSEGQHVNAGANASGLQPHMNTSAASRSNTNERKAQRPRPTHFIAIPLNTNQTIRNNVSRFQNAILQLSDSLQGSETNRVRGLDPSIVIDPRRFHFTLGVMALEDPAPTPPSTTSTHHPTLTVESALALLRSLKPALSEIISGSVDASGDGKSNHGTPNLRQAQASATTAPPLRVILDRIDIMDPVAPPSTKKREGESDMRNSGVREEVSAASFQKGGSSAIHDGENDIEEIWSRVLYMAPSLVGVEGEKLRRISDLVHQTFKRAGYVTDTRPLKLHCTVLNASHRRPPRLRGDPFSYSDILKSGTLSHLSPTPNASLQSQTTTNVSPTRTPNAPLNSSTSVDPHPKTPEKSKSKPNAKRGAAPPLPVPIDLGDEVDVHEIGLWIMGSRGPNNEYVSCGGVKLG